MGSGTLCLGDVRVKRLGYGAMRLRTVSLDELDVVTIGLRIYINTDLSKRVGVQQQLARRLS